MSSKSIVDDINERKMSITTRKIGDLHIRCVYGAMPDGYGDIAVERFIYHNDSLPCSNCGNTFTLECSSCLRDNLQRTKIKILERTIEEMNLRIINLEKLFSQYCVRDISESEQRTDTQKEISTDSMMTTTTTATPTTITTTPLTNTLVIKQQ